MLVVYKHFLQEKMGLVLVWHISFMYNNRDLVFHIMDDIDLNISFAHLNCCFAIFNYQ